MAIIGLVSSTHFALDGSLYPRVYTVYPRGANGARLSAAGDKDLGVPLGSTIGASTPTDQAALIQALAPIVMSSSSPGSGGSSSASDIALEIKSGGPVTVAGTVGIAGSVALGGPVTLNPLPAGSANIGSLLDLARITGSIVPGVGAEHLGKAAGGGYAAGSTGIMPLAAKYSTELAIADGDGSLLPLRLDGFGRLRTTFGALPAGANRIGSVGHGITGIGDGVQTVTTAGTGRQLTATSTPAQWVIVQAQTDNAGLVAVGGEGINANEAAGTGLALAAGESTTLPCANLTQIWIDATVNGEGARFTYLI